MMILSSNKVVLDVDNKIIELGKIAITIKLFWHKRADVGSITIHTAGEILLQLGDYFKIKQYVNLGFMNWKPQIVIGGSWLKKNN
jgi:hypothetical protein